MDASYDRLIMSASNDRIKELKKLMKSSAARREKGLYVVEGIRMFREIPAEDIEAVYVACSSKDRFSEYLSAGLIGVTSYVRDNVFAAVSGTDTPQGIMATVKIRSSGLKDILSAGDSPFILIADRLQDPGNVGTIIRTAEAAGVTGIILSKDTVDLYNPKVVRSTMGSIFRMKICSVESVSEAVGELKKSGVTIYGAHLNGNNIYGETISSACAFLIGNEGKGLSDEVIGMADKLIRIPMEGQVESLNAATSTAVIAYEVLRQKKYNI